MIKKFELPNFRLFHAKSIIFGRFLTLISGMNSTGKSTILALLGTSCELKNGRKQENLYRMDFTSILKGHITHDPTGSNKCKIEFFDDDHRLLRVTWQNKKTRFRVIPYKVDINGYKTESKKECPVIYLGLSRLFPIGESQISANITLILDSDEKDWFKKNYTEIMSSYSENINSIDTIKIIDTAKKSGIGISTDKYSCLANSAGQDNLGQILYALIRFKRLKTQLGVNYPGGLFLVDEIDATLHPLAQNKLIDFLINECQENNIQIVCTTHSASLLTHVCQKIRINSTRTNNNNIELIYLTNANRSLEIKRNPPCYEIENGLLVPRLPQNIYKLKLYSEDDEARWFIKNLLSDYASYVDILDTNIGWENLLYLYKGDMPYFCNVALVFDGDVVQAELDSALVHVNPKLKNILILPGGKRPESVIYDYLTSLDSSHPYWQVAYAVGFTWTYFMEHSPQSYPQPREREKYKHWFQDHRSSFDSTNLYSYWFQDNEALARQFTGEFKGVYNIIAERLFYRKL